MRMEEEILNENSDGLIRIKPHTKRKYRILDKYVKACSQFNNKYQNFAYIDTHGGTGRIIDDKTEEELDGSVLTAAQAQPTWPCYCIEINEDRFSLLKESTENVENINLYCGDCNEIVDDILEDLDLGERFVFCFVDPDALTYRDGSTVKSQITWKTLEKISSFPRTELLFNFMVGTVMRQKGAVQSNPKTSTSRAVSKHLTMLFGTDKWKELDKGDYRGFVRLFIDERFQHYKFKGAVLIRHEDNRGPLYYLIYGTNHSVGSKIMRHSMMKEWVDKTKSYPLTRRNYSSQEKWLDGEYPLRLFIFED